MKNVCKHCGEGVADLKMEFCCNGCAVAYRVIDGLNLKDYYDYCRSIYNKNPMKVHSYENKLNYDDAISESKEGYKANLLVDGIHCGSCVWLIENALKKESEIQNARVNLSTKRLVVEWHGDKSVLARIISIIQNLGYKPLPFTPDEGLEQNLRKERELLKYIFISGFASMAMMMIMWGVWAGNSDGSMGTHTRDLMHWFAAMIAIPASLISGLPFFRSAGNVLRGGNSNMDVPISLAIILSLLVSIQQTYLSSEYTYYDAAVSLIFFLLIGRYLDLKMRNKARTYAQNLVLGQAKSVTVLRGGELLLVNLKDALPGEIAFVAAGEKIPVDGVIIEGDTDIDNSLISGETRPCSVSVGDKVMAGTINMNSPIKIRITELGDNTILGEIIRLMENAEQSKARFVRIADLVASYYTKVVLVLSSITFISWYFWLHSALDIAILHGVSVLIITCPCALGLAVPVVQIIASSRLMSQGILVKTSDALEKLNQFNHIIFDKTGTLTVGHPVLQNVKDIPEDKLQVIASLALRSQHPLSKAMQKAYDGELIEVTVEEIKGQGLQAIIDGEFVRLGSRSFCGVETSDADEYNEVFFKYGQKPEIRMIFQDDLKSDAKQVIDWLGNVYPIEILSGDRTEVVKKIAIELGISDYKGKCSPQDKFDHINQLTGQGKKVLMIGDGLNDSAALKLAFVSMSPASSLDVAQASADIVFQGDVLSPMQESIVVAKASNALIKQNFTLSLLYNAVFIPVAMAGLSTPIMAALVMSASSIMVVLNSMRLVINQFKKIKLR